MLSVAPRPQPETLGDERTVARLLGFTEKALPLLTLAVRAAHK